MRNTISRGQASVVPSLEVLSCTPPAKGRPTRPPRRPPKAQAAARHKTRRGAARGTPPSRGQPRRRPRPPQTAYSSPGPQRMSSRFAVHVRSAARHVVCSVKEMETARCGDWCPAMTCPASSAAASSPFGENNCPCLFLRPAVTTPAVAPWRSTNVKIVTSILRQPVMSVACLSPPRAYRGAVCVRMDHHWRARGRARTARARGRLC